MIFVVHVYIRAFNVHDFSFLQKIERPELLYESVIEVDERVVMQQERCELKRTEKTVESKTGEKVVCFFHFGVDFLFLHFVIYQMV